MVSNVVVVGGGTAGWMTASYLQAAFADRVKVTVVESGRVATIGVGEATASTIRHFFGYIGLTESEWMPHCNATYKLAVRFENWTGDGSHFYHPFERLRVVDGFPLTDWWLHEQPSRHFDRDSLLVASVVEAGRSPRHLDGRLMDQAFVETAGGPGPRSTLADLSTQFPYAYHFDAALLAEFLAKRTTRRGVARIIDDVLDVALDEQGRIDHLVTREHGEIRGDLYIDCTGFRGLLINQALGEPFQTYQDTLPNNRAVALRVPIDMETHPFRPCTTATAMPAGWAWTIPLQGRIGTGYVYSDEYATPEEAEATLREFVGPDAADLPANHIRMRVGRTRRSWVANCVAIGLSSGFVEPLESTGIFFIQHCVEQLVKHFPANGWDDVLRESYNRSVAHSMDGIREFLVLHYRAAARNDNAYWQDAKTRVLPDGMSERLAQWERQLPNEENIYPNFHCFESYSYVCILLGLRGLPTRAAPPLSLMDPTAARKEFDLIRSQAQTLVETLPSHREYLASMR